MSLYTLVLQFLDSPLLGWVLASALFGLMSITDLLSPPTQAQTRATMVTALVGLGIPADKWKSGGVFSSVLTVLAATYSAFGGLIVQAIGAGFLNTATGGWLTLIAYYVYGVTRPQATFASGQVTFVNSGGGIYTFNPGELTLQNPTTLKTYVNAAAVTIPASSTVTGVPIVATVAGSASSSAPGTITALLTPLLGVTVSNPLSVNGLDAMSDPDLRTLCTNKLGALSVRGPRNAYKYAISVALRSDGSPVNVNRATVSPSSSTGQVTIFVASPSGVVSAGDLTAISASIEAIARPDAVTVILASATTVAYTPTLTVWAQALPGLAASTVQAEVANALSLFLSLYPIGGLTKTTGPVEALFASEVTSVAGAADPAIFAVDGATDLILTAGQVATDGITVNVNLV